MKVLKICFLQQNLPRFWGLKSPFYNDSSRKTRCTIYFPPFCYTLNIRIRWPAISRIFSIQRLIKFWKKSTNFNKGETSICYKREASIFKMMMDVVARKIFQIFSLEFEWLQFSQERSILTFLNAARCKIIFERNKLTSAKAKQSYISSNYRVLFTFISTVTFFSLYWWN